MTAAVDGDLPRIRRGCEIWGERGIL